LFDIVAVRVIISLSISMLTAGVIVGVSIIVTGICFLEAIDGTGN